MKKIISLVLILITCFSLAACGTEPEETGIIDAAYLGEWFTYSGTYGTDGLIISAEKVALTLNEDGSAFYGSTKGTWAYNTVENQVWVNFPEHNLRLNVNQIDGYTVLENDWFNGFYESFFREGKDSYEAAYERITREWYSDSYDILSFEENGTIIFNGKTLESEWSICCLGPYIVIDYGEKKPTYIKLKATSQEELYMFWEEKSYFCSSEYATLITVDNWKEHFNSDLEEVFDISYEIDNETNEWGETKYYWLNQKFELKDKRYGENTRLTVEFVCGADAQRFCIDKETGSVLQEHVGESPYSGEKVTFELNSASDLKLLHKNNYEHYVYYAASGEIVRMKGFLFTAEYDSLPPG